MNYLQERTRMVESQIRARGVRDKRVLDAFLKVPRHLFVPEDQHKSAYGDHPLPIGEGQTISQPYMVASMTEVLDLSGSERVLEIGTGSGYQAAILAELADRVYSVERIETLAGKASTRLRDLGYDNIEVILADGTLGWPAAAPYGGIMVTAGAPETPKPLIEQLDMGARLVIPVGKRHTQIVEIHQRVADDSIKTSHSTACRFVDLIGKHGW